MRVPCGTSASCTDAGSIRHVPLDYPGIMQHARLLHSGSAVPQLEHMLTNQTLGPNECLVRCSCHTAVVRERPYFPLLTFGKHDLLERRLRESSCIKACARLVLIAAFMGVACLMHSVLSTDSAAGIATWWIVVRQVCTHAQLESSPLTAPISMTAAICNTQALSGVRAPRR
jgi:hypothetical protein